MRRLEVYQEEMKEAKVFKEALRKIKRLAEYGLSMPLEYENDTGLLCSMAIV